MKCLKSLATPLPINSITICEARGHFGSHASGTMMQMLFQLHSLAGGME